MKLIPFQTCALITVFSALVASCKSRTYNDDSKSKGFLDFLNGGKSFDSEVVGKRKCTAEYTASHKLLSPKKPTRVYHWTNDPNALSNPQNYLSELVKISNKKNSEMVPESNGNIPYTYGMVGLGLYVASTPFSSFIFGNNLITFEISLDAKFHKLVAKSPTDLNYRKDGFEAFSSDCDGLIYPFANRKFGNTSVENDGLAIVLWDLKSINPESILTFSPKTKTWPNFGPYFMDLFANRTLISRLILAETKIPWDLQDVAKVNEIRKYWGEQPSLYDWE